MTKPILCLDFDGVCHSYTSGWQGIMDIPDDPVPGLFEFLMEANQHYEIHIFSSRSGWQEGIEAMKAWFDYYWHIFVKSQPAVMRPVYRDINIPARLQFPNHKPPAVVTLDDRALTFTGVWPEISVLQKFQPWTRGQDALF